MTSSMKNFYYFFKPCIPCLTYNTPIGAAFSYLRKKCVFSNTYTLSKKSGFKIVRNIAANCADELLVMKKSDLMIRILLLTNAIGMAGFGSCAVSPTEFCAMKSPELEAGIEGAIAALIPWDKEGRYLASVPGALEDGTANWEAVQLSEADRLHWARWAEDRLRETQHYVDVMSEYTKMADVKFKLGEIANEFVAFHAYCQKGRADRMIKTLRRLQAKTVAARDLACAPTSAPKQQ